MGIQELNVNKRRAWWIIWSFFPPFNGVGMTIIGNKTRKRTWRNYGLLYTSISFFTTFILSETTGSLNEFSNTIFAVSWIISIIHSFKIRKEALLRVEVLETQKHEQDDLEDLRAKVAKEYGIEPINPNSILNDKKENRYLKENQPGFEEVLTNSSSEEQRISLQNTFSKKDNNPNISNLINESDNRQNLVDVNHCNEDELSGLPGVGVILAKKALGIRQNYNGFTCIDDFIQKTGIKPHFAEKLKTMVCCTPINNPQMVRTSGRMVDF